MSQCLDAGGDTGWRGAGGMMLSGTWKPFLRLFPHSIFSPIPLFPFRAVTLIWGPKPASHTGRDLPLTLHFGAGNQSEGCSLGIEQNSTRWGDGLLVAHVSSGRGHWMGEGGSASPLPQCHLSQAGPSDGHCQSSPLNFPLLWFQDWPAVPLGRTFLLVL